MCSRACPNPAADGSAVLWGEGLTANGAPRSRYFTGEIEIS